MDQQDYFYGEVKHNYWKGNLKLFLHYTGYYLSEAPILASMNPKYDTIRFSLDFTMSPFEIHVEYTFSNSNPHRGSSTFTLQKYFGLNDARMRASGKE